MRVPRQEMNVRMSEICQRYDQDYWLWTPADFDLADTAKRAKALQEHEALYKACPRLDGIFIPGGDPGENHPSLVLPFMKDLSVVLARYHPKAKVWLSLQGFRGDRAEYVYRYPRSREAGLVRRDGVRAEQPEHPVHTPAARPALSDPKLSGYHAQRPLPVPDPLVGHGAGHDARSRGDQPTPGAVRGDSQRLRPLHGGLPFVLRRRA